MEDEKLAAMIKNSKKATEIKTDIRRGKVNAIKTNVKAVINSRYEHLGNQVTIEAEGYSNAALLDIMELMVRELKNKL